MILDMPDGYRTPGPQMNDLEPGQTTMSPHLVPGHPPGAPPHIPFMHGAGTPPYIGAGAGGGHSPGAPSGPPPHPMVAPFPAYSDALPAYQAALASSLLVFSAGSVGGILPPSLSGGPASDLSSNGSNPGYPEFPPSPDSWLGDMQPDQAPPPSAPNHQY
ncbi:hypothetical protein Anas_06803 [Armadillidium nasatum]|uniref:Uncharacterized protein n=1 Tax=Armadillidium nasatum TaxID=96803 RepID=A0A5N5SZ02_9CRUS|nr:hypothetical protein Anas_06803 [Armadillidium nasatum]